MSVMIGAIQMRKNIVAVNTTAILRRLVLLLVKASAFRGPCTRSGIGPARTEPHNFLSDELPHGGETKRVGASAPHKSLQKLASCSANPRRAPSTTVEHYMVKGYRWC